MNDIEVAVDKSEVPQNGKKLDRAEEEEKKHSLKGPQRPPHRRSRALEYQKLGLCCGGLKATSFEDVINITSGYI